MQCVIYKGKKKEDHYIYLPEADNFEKVPEAVKKLMGEFIHAMTLEITEDSKLANSDPKEVLSKIKEQGFYLQIPPKIESLLKKTNDLMSASKS